MARNGTDRYNIQYHDKQRSRIKYVPIIQNYVLYSATIFLKNTVSIACEWQMV